MSLGRFLIAILLGLVVLGLIFGGGEEETATDAPAIPVAEAESEAPSPTPPAKEPEPKVPEQAAPKMMEPKTMSPAPPASAPAMPPETQDVIFRVTGDPGIRFQGSIATAGTSESVQGTTPMDFPLEVDTGLFSGDIVSANAQNMAGAGNITVGVVVDGVVQKEANTSAQYGLAQVTWMPGE